MGYFLTLKIVVIGSGGRLGAALVRHLSARHEVLPFDRRAIDITRPELMEDRLAPIGFDCLVNAAAMTSVDECERRKEEAHAVNAAAPERLAAMCANQDATMVQISTDYVYDGTEVGSKAESAPLNPLGVYATSKLAGEEAVLAAGQRNLVLRTAWVFGPDRPSFIDAMLKRATTSGTVEAVEDKFGSPTYSNDFGLHLENLLESGQAGVFNVSNEGCCSWREYAQCAVDIGRELGLGLSCKTVEGIRLDAMTQFLAPRPRHTALSVGKLGELSGSRPRSWKDALADYLATFYAGS